LRHNGHLLTPGSLTIHHQLNCLVLIGLLGTTAVGQSNTVPGRTVNLYDVSSPRFWGRAGPAHPNGAIGFTSANYICNPGTVTFPMIGAMNTEHPKFATMVTRLDGDRMVQISDWSYVKHAFGSLNWNVGPCQPCNDPGTWSIMGIGCFDVYDSGTNGNRVYLGPPGEVDPWLGTWDPIGSYFDRGDPDVGPPQNTDGVRSLSSSQINAFDVVKNRVIVQEQDLLVPGALLFYQMHVILEGEDVNNRANNLRSRGLDLTWDGSTWNAANVGASQGGSVLNFWPGATLNLGGNGNDDGRFAVASKVTGPVGGLYRYEYAVHNIDNHRGGASFRIPLSTAVTVQNVGFRDIDANALNDWTFSQTASELSWTASATNPHNWNTIYNFYFDCDTAPGQSSILIDQARLGPGALTVTVASEVPGGIPTATVTPVGTGCDYCNDTFYEFFALPSSMDLSGTSMTMTYNGSQYSVGSGTSSYQAPSGGALSLGDDDETTITLPFALPYPGGTTTQLHVCSNGFISPAASNGTGYAPSIPELLSGSSRWCVWHDFDTGGGGQIRVDSSPSQVNVTWEAVASWGVTGTSTFQFQFLPDGTVHVIYQSMSNVGGSYLVGYSPGGSATDPGGIDLTTAVPAGFTLCAGSNNSISLTTDLPPILGTTIQQIASGIPPGTPFGVHVMSLSQEIPPIDLTTYGMTGCFAHTSPAGSVNEFIVAPGATVQVPFAIPSSSSFTGLRVVGQGYYATGGTPLGITNTNGSVMELAPQ